MLGMLFRYRATCPGCAHRLPRRHALRGGVRCCDACARPILPSEPLNSFGNAIAGVLLSITLITAALLVAANWHSLPFAALMVAGFFALSSLIWPYTTAFSLAPLAPSVTCPICGYDLRATPERCPECGTVAPLPARPDQPPPRP